MASATVEQVKAMDYGFEGIPFVSFPLDITVDIKKMDYGFEGIPFVVNYTTEAVTTISELPSESITIIDAPGAFNTTCRLVEDATITDALIGILLVAEMAEDIAIAESFSSYNSICSWIDNTVIVDAFSVFNMVSKLPAEDIAVMDGLYANSNFFVLINEGLNNVDSLVLCWNLLSIDNLMGADIAAPSLLYVDTAAETLFTYDQAFPGWQKTVPESLTLIDVTSSLLTIFITEWLTLIDTLFNNWHGQEVIPETLNLYDLAVGIQKYFHTVSESLAATDTAMLQITVAVLEYLRFTELVATIQKITRSIEESVILVDEAQKGFDKIIEETLSTVDVSTIIASFFNSVAESLTATDTISLIKRLAAPVTDSLVFTEIIVSKGIFCSAIYDTLHMNILVELDGEVWECYVLNTPKFYPSMYSGFNFNSYCVFENRAFGANETGVYELTGKTDTGATIHTGVILSETDFGSPNEKRFRRGYIGIEGDAPVMVLETEDGRRKAYAINNEGKVVYSSDLKSKLWKLSIADFSELNTVKLIPVILTK